MESTEEFSKYASILLDVAVDKPLDYGIPKQLTIQRGMQVCVPVRGSLRNGYVIEIKDKSSFHPVLPIHSVVSEKRLLSNDLLELAFWMSRYYATSLQQVIQKMLPPSVRKALSHKQQYFVTLNISKERTRSLCKKIRESHASQAQILDILLMQPKGMLLTQLLEKAKVSRSPIQTLLSKNILHIKQVHLDRCPLKNQEYFKTEPKTLNEEQANALKCITKTLEKNTFKTHLLFGVTGSGKTEVYLQAIDYALKLDKTAIMLVPEISLTGQTIERFRARFDDKIAILHHRLSEGQRRDEWYRIHRGDAKIVIGARSAIFSPTPHLGLIIVDEEHDGAYKQSENQPCYHARDVAVMRGKLLNATVILGTATPSLESYHNAQCGKYALCELNFRAKNSSLPQVHIVDMRQEFEKKGGYTLFCEKLIDAIKKRLELGEQILLFLNRRGYHTSLFCRQCGHIFKCPHCDLALTFHRGDQLLACHLCDYRLLSLPTFCSHCHAPETLKYRGVGTEQVERALPALFPELRSIRIDGDTTRHKGSHERLLRSFSTGKADLLIGTQMITKGLHFPGVTLVAVLNADASLHIPDFRSSETVFQLITQVAGRAGREELAGEVIIQTQIPDNETIKQASRLNYVTFYQSEINSRQAFLFPPFSHLIKLTFSGIDLSLTQNIANTVREVLIKGLGKNYLIHPVVPSGHAKIKDHYRFQCLIRGSAVYPVTTLIKQLKDFRRGVKMHVDVDPLSTFF